MVCYLSILTISFTVSSLALGQSRDCHIANEDTERKVWQRDRMNLLKTAVWPKQDHTKYIMVTSSKRFPRYRPFMLELHWPLDFPHKGPAMQRFAIFLGVIWIGCLTNCCVVDHLRSYYPNVASILWFYKMCCKYDTVHDSANLDACGCA